LVRSLVGEGRFDDRYWFQVRKQSNDLIAWSLILIHLETDEAEPPPFPIHSTGIILLYWL